MDFAETYILENDVVRLQPLQAGDYEHLLPYSEKEPDIWAFNFNGAEGAGKLRKYIDTAITNRQNEMAYPFIVYDKRTDRYVGCTRFLNFRPEYKILEIGFTWYGKEYQGTAVNKNCKYLMLEFAFEKMNQERVGFAASNKNERSKNAMKSIGCIEEGVLRNASIDAEGNRIDVVLLGIVREEWFGHVKEDLKNKLALMGNQE